MCVLWCVVVCCGVLWCCGCGVARCLCLRVLCCVLCVLYAGRVRVEYIRECGCWMCFH